MSHEDEAYEAIEKALRVLKVIPEECVLVDYVIIVEGSQRDYQNNCNREQWGMAFHHGETRRTAALGLLQVGTDIMMNGDVVDDDS